MTTKTNESLDRPPLQMDLYDDLVPGAVAGNYRLVVQQTAHYSEKADDGETLAGAVQYLQFQRFQVQGPRYSLASDEVQALFPPHRGAGDYSRMLPHIVLRKRTLPWERLIDPKREDVEPLPWLALLVFSQAELDQAWKDMEEDDKPPATLLRTMTAADLVSNSTHRITRSSNKITLLPDLEDEGDAGDQKTTVQTLELPIALLRSVLPTWEDLRYSAHVRCVDTANKAPLAMHADGDFAVIVANRFPQAGSNVLVLVSLEGWAPLLNGAAAPQEVDRVRVVTLGSWTFVNDTGVFTFGKLMERVDPGLLQAANGDAGQPAVANALQRGYVPLDYRPQESAPTFGWYRGPFAPLPVAPLASDQPFHRADAALVLDRDTGVFDVSYAAAWQLGRLLALAALSFAADLRHFLDLSHDTLDAASAIESFLENQRPAMERLWRREQATLIEKLRSGGLDDEALEELLDVLESGGLGWEEARKRLADLGAGKLDPAVQALLDAAGATQPQASDLAAATDELLHWIARLVLLYPVPFDYLVPHARLLPAESLRFFYVDDNWTEALLEGALSIAYSCARDHEVMATSRTALRSSVSQLVSQYRKHLLNLLDPADALAGVGADDYLSRPKTGFLLRSEAVAGWPGMEVEVYSAQNKPLPVLRMDHLGPGLLLCVVDGELGSIVFKEPAEGIRFGVDDDGSVVLRAWQGDTAGRQLEAGKVTAVQASYARAGAAAGVLDIGGLADDLREAGANAGGGAQSAFLSAAFSLQMLLLPESQRINWRRQPA